MMCLNLGIVACVLISSICATLQAPVGSPAWDTEVGLLDIQPHWWPLNLSTETSARHSSGSDGFSLQGRHMLDTSQALSLADSGTGIIEYRPVGYNIDGSEFAKFFMRAHANKRCTGIKLASGTYHVTPSYENGAHIYMECSRERQTPFLVEWSGVFFYFTKGEVGGLTLKNCTNVELRGPHEQMYTDDQLMFAQGTIVAADDDKLEYTVQVDEGYPADKIMMHTEDMSIIFYYSKTLLVKKPPSTFVAPAGTDSRKSLGGRKYSFTTRSLTPNITVGDYFAAVAGNDAMGLWIPNSKNCTVRGATIYHAGGMGTLLSDSLNITLTGLQIRPFPKPLGRDGKLPLISSSLDGLHIANARGGIIVTNSYILNTGDDGVAMHGSYYTVAEADASSKTVIVATLSGFEFTAGDQLLFYKGNTERLASAMIVKMYSVEQPESTRGKSTSSIGGSPLKMEDAMFMKCELDVWPKSLDRLRFDDIVTSPTLTSSGFAFVGNTVGNRRGRGMIIKCSNGVIANNNLFNLNGYAMQLSPEFYPAEADFVTNVLVMNNTINSYGPGIWLGDNPVDCANPPSPYANNYNVDFVNNTIANVEQTPFLVTSAAGISIINTTFVNVLCSNVTIERCENWQVKKALVMMANVRDVTFSGNSVITNGFCKQPSGNYDQPVAIVNATEIHGLEPAAAVHTLLQAEGR